MKKLLLLLALISTFAFGIDKKTPTGGTVKDKPGKSQANIGMEKFITFSGPHHDVTGWKTISNGSTPIVYFSAPAGTWECSAWLTAGCDDPVAFDLCITTVLNSSTGCVVGKNQFPFSSGYTWASYPMFIRPVRIVLPSDGTIYLNANQLTNFWVYTSLYCIKVG